MTQAANDVTMTKGNLGPIPVLGRALCVANGGVPILRRRLRYAEFTFLHLFPVEDVTRKLTSSIALRKYGLNVVKSEIRSVDDLEAAIEAFKGRAEALYFCSDPLVTTNRRRITTLALGARLPTMFAFREYVEAGGLMSYGPNFPDLFRRAAEYVDKILRGAKPSDLPVEQPTKFDLVINSTTAKVLGLKISEAFLLRANEIIE